MLWQLGRSLDKDDSHLLPLGELRPIHTSTHMLFSTFASFCFYSGYSMQATEMLLGANLRGQSITYVNILYELYLFLTLSILKCPAKKYLTFFIMFLFFDHPPNSVHIFYVLNAC